jgi:DNA-binding transcriptional ArsR family regulator
MLTTTTLAVIGSLVGDPARANMLVALMDGRALTATELADIASITPSTASSHLAQLITGGLLVVEPQGRHRYHRLASPAIAQMIEGMMTIAVSTSGARGKALRLGPKGEAMRQARTCYDHLAGRVAVAIADQMIARGEIEFGIDGGEVTELGARKLESIGIDVTRAQYRKREQRAFCRPCLDWSERRPHIAGSVGKAMLLHFTSAAWVRRVAGSRALTVTPLGQLRLTALFGLDADLWNARLTT